jgi:hypothetical protein
MLSKSFEEVSSLPGYGFKQGLFFARQSFGTANRRSLNELLRSASLAGLAVLLAVQASFGQAPQLIWAGQLYCTAGNHPRGHHQCR